MEAKKIIMVEMEPDMHLRLKVLAARQGRPMTKLIREAVAAVVELGEEEAGAADNAEEVAQHPQAIGEVEGGALLGQDVDLPCQGIEVEPGVFAGCDGGVDCPACQGAP